MFWFKSFLLLSKKHPNKFQYIICFGSSLFLNLGNINKKQISIHYMFWFKIRTAGYYFLCVAISIHYMFWFKPKKNVTSRLSKKDFNTLYVLVQGDHFQCPSIILREFQYIICFGSRRRIKKAYWYAYISIHYMFWFK